MASCPGRRTAAIVHQAHLVRLLLSSLAGAALLFLLLSARTLAQEPPGGTFAGDVPAGAGVALVRWGGGSIQDMLAAAPRAESFWVTRGGEFVGYTPGAPPFVNARFLEEHAAGVPVGSVVLLRLGEPGPYVPLVAQECARIFDAMEAALGAGETIRSEAEFAHPPSGASGTGCRFEVAGSGEDFDHYVAVARSLRDVLSAEGWDEDINFAADSPVATLSGFHRGDAIALVEAGVSAPGVECPDDVPIGVCFEDLSPSRMRIEASVTLARP